MVDVVNLDDIVVARVNRTLVQKKSDDIVGLRVSMGRIFKSDPSPVNSYLAYRGDELEILSMLKQMVVDFEVYCEEYPKHVQNLQNADKDGQIKA